MACAEPACVLCWPPAFGLPGEAHDSLYDHGPPGDRNAHFKTVGVHGKKPPWSSVAVRTCRMVLMSSTLDVGLAPCAKRNHCHEFADRVRKAERHQSRELRLRDTKIGVCLGNTVNS